jgi:hypothetical protein
MLWWRNVSSASSTRINTCFRSEAHRQLTQIFTIVFHVGRWWAGESLRLP